MIKKLVFVLILLSLSLFTQSRLPLSVFASHCATTDYDCQISEIQREMDALSPAHENNKKELGNLNKQLDDLKRRITTLSTQLKNTEKDISKREDDLAYARAVFDEKAQSHYKFIRTYDPLLPFLSVTNATRAFKEVILRQRAADGDRETMEKYAGDILKLKTDKEALEKNKNNLANVQKTLDSQAKFLSSEVSKVENYLDTLSAKQTELAALKAGGFQTSVGDTPPTLEPCSGPPGSSNFCDPGFRPAFAAFSFVSSAP